MPVSGGITLFHVRGIRISADWSWFIVLFLVIIYLTGNYRNALDAEDGAIGPYALSVASALLFFGSILLHELGHAFMAERKGIGTTGITLWMFGGVARLDRDSDTAGTEFKVAAAGPAVTAVIVVICVAAGILIAGPGDFADAAVTDGSGSDVSGAEALLGWLAGINLLVLVFNLLPAFPLDGGRIARAIAWRWTGSRAKATRIAATLGQGFAYVMIAGGAFLFVQGAGISGIWLAVIGFMLSGSARGAIAQTAVTERLEGVAVADVMDGEPVVIPEVETVEQALESYFLRYGWDWFPVTDAAQRFVGLIDRATADGVPAVERDARTVSQIVARGAGALTVSADAPLESILGNEGLRRLGALIAVDGDGRVSGVLTAQAVGRALRDPSD